MLISFTEASSGVFPVLADADWNLQLGIIFHSKISLTSLISIDSADHPELAYHH
jgi:hypothetical protein